MKKVVALLLIAAAIIVPVFAQGGTESAGPVTLVLSEVHAEGYPTTLHGSEAV